MANYSTKTFLRLRSQPVVATGNVILVMPPGTIVSAGGTAPDGWTALDADINGNPVNGYAATVFLEPVAGEIPAAAPLVSLPAAMLSPGTKLISRTSEGRAYPLDEPELLTANLQKLGSPADRAQWIHKIIQYLDVEKSLRYQPGNGKTFCNIYAFDVAFCLGAYLPRVWWTTSSIQKLVAGDPIPANVGTTEELSANALADWFESYASSFGWERVLDLVALQAQADTGRLGIIVGQRVKKIGSGHIDVVVPQTDTLKAATTNGIITSPLQSQAGSRNKQYFTGINWWQDATRFQKFSFWLWPQKQ